MSSPLKNMIEKIKLEVEIEMIDKAKDLNDTSTASKQIRKALKLNGIDLSLSAEEINKKMYNKMHNNKMKIL